MTIESLLPYLLPPLLGAVIGYVTNYVAIRMLFRPLHPWRVLGIRLPLTPGIIPAKRGELAQKMGDMVGSHLLTAEDVGRTLGKESFRHELRGAVAEKLGALVDRDLGPVGSLVPPTYRHRFDEFVEVLCWKASRAVIDYLNSDECEERLRAFVRSQTDVLLARDLESFLTPERYEALRCYLEDRVGELQRSPELSRAVTALVDERIDRLLASDRPVRELLPSDVVDVLISLLDREVPPLLEKFGGMLYDPEFRARLVKKAKEAIENFLDSLEGFSGLLSGFVNLDKLYDRIPEFLDKAGDEISRWLREEKTQQQVSAMLRERLEAILEPPPAKLLEKVPYEKVAEMRAFVRGRVVEAIRSPRTAQLCVATAEQGIDRVKDVPFAEICERLFPEGGSERALQTLETKLLEFLRSATVREVVEEVVHERARYWLHERPIGKISAHLAGDLREEFEVEVCRQVLEFLKKEVPVMVETLNVQRMVEEKVNSLDILKVEGLLLGIMRDQFKYINLFGALLGLLIGLGNVALLHWL